MRWAMTLLCIGTTRRTRATAEGQRARPRAPDILSQNSPCQCPPRRRRRRRRRRIIRVVSYSWMISTVLGCPTRRGRRRVEGRIWWGEREGGPRRCHPPTRQKGSANIIEHRPHQRLDLPNLPPPLRHRRVWHQMITLPTSGEGLENSSTMYPPPPTTTTSTSQNPSLLLPPCHYHRRRHHRRPSLRGSVTPL